MSSATQSPLWLTSTEQLTWASGMNSSTLRTRATNLTRGLAPRLTTPTFRLVVTSQSGTPVRPAPTASRSVWPALGTALTSQAIATCPSLARPRPLITISLLRPTTPLSLLSTPAAQRTSSSFISWPATTLLVTPCIIKWWALPLQLCPTLTSASWLNVTTKAIIANMKAPLLQAYSFSDLIL